MASKSFTLLTVIVLINIFNCFAEENYVEDDQTMKIDLYQRSPTEENGSVSGSKDPNGSISILDYMNQEFYGKISIGRPGQTLNVVFDTTWIYTWVLSSKCSSIYNIGCYFHNKYNHDKSSDYKPDGRKFFVNLGIYNLTGFYSYDNISVSQYNVSNFSFIEITEVPKSFIINKADGVVGLGQKASNYDPLFYALSRQGKVRNSLFSIYFNRNYGSYKRGSIMLGYIDRNLTRSRKINGTKVYDEILYLPAPGLSYWQLHMDQIVMVHNSTRNSTFCAKGCNAVLYSSSSTITGPAKEVAQIHKFINAEKFLMDRYSVDCKKVDSLPAIHFRVRNKTFTLTGPKYVTKISYKFGTLCLTAFQEADTSTWFLGGAFLSEAYTIYDVAQRRIGLVNAA
ncbi:hypothetical protein WA026_017922 [Henosepilachna vigintioctopunctata]|uniref:Peptidase A1 domain-containing protein n=1 Tax=Henosepilachna vigintioctopunctata TaxID=420089 RepID=A0AAW1TQ46_9CUCU